MSIDIQEITLEQLNPQEKEALREVLVKSYSQYQSQIDEEFWERYITDIKQSVDSPHVDIAFLAKEDNQIVGSAKIYIGSKHAYSNPQLNITDPILRFLAVDPEKRGKRIAEQLVEACIRYTKKLGYETLVLFTSGTLMTSAVKVYERMGFIRDAQIEQLFEDDLDTRCYTINVDSYLALSSK